MLSEIRNFSNVRGARLFGALAKRSWKILLSSSADAKAQWTSRRPQDRSGSDDGVAESRRDAPAARWCSGPGRWASRSSLRQLRIQRVAGLWTPGFLASAGNRRGSFVAVLTVKN